MDTVTLTQWLFLGWVGVALGVFVTLFFLSAPYGRHGRSGWGPDIAARTGWIVMEAPSLLLMVGLFLTGHRFDAIQWLAVCLWGGHYTYRSFIYPMLARLEGRTMPLSIAVMAIVFNLGNAGFNGLVLFHWDTVLPQNPVGQAHGLVGLLLFAVGFCIHVHSDHVLRTLRAPGESGYRIPHSGLHRWVASPNYFGECLQWCGFAILTWNLAGLSFALWTIANLLPRALSNHRWYKTTFEDYPRHRTALVPFVL